MKKVNTYEILLVGSENVDTLAVVKSEGLANIIVKSFQDIYKNTEFKVVKKATKKKLKEFSRVEYEMSLQK